MLIEESSGSSIEAKIVGGVRDCLWSDSGCFNCTNKLIAGKLGWSTNEQYYFSDHTNTELIVSATVEFPG
ncbi:MAG: hypothetical protein OXD32_05785 [Endozoicomonadaceae bacterium]|nr:hypothetical protein [Endozoicomonadaceae bacterium]MCY4328811.1 hypothetical protein [Endozoicomonadaceae bacterium]